MIEWIGAAMLIVVSAAFMTLILLLCVWGIRVMWRELRRDER